MNSRAQASIPYAEKSFNHRGHRGHTGMHGYSKAEI